MILQQDCLSQVLIWWGLAFICCLTASISWAKIFQNRFIFILPFTISVWIIGLLIYCYIAPMKSEMTEAFYILGTQILPAVCGVIPILVVTRLYSGTSKEGE